MGILKKELHYDFVCGICKHSVYLFMFKCVFMSKYVSTSYGSSYDRVRWPCDLYTCRLGLCIYLKPPVSWWVIPLKCLGASFSVQTLLFMSGKMGIFPQLIRLLCKISVAFLLKFVSSEKKRKNTELSSFCKQKAEMCLLAACAKNRHNYTW